MNKSLHPRVVMLQLSVIGEPSNLWLGWRVSRDLCVSSFSKGSKKTLLQYPAHIALIHFFNGYVCGCELATCVWAPGCGRVRVGWGEGVAGQGCSLGCKI